ncbi:Olfactory receptor [Dirofilaria immitis]
MDHTVELASNIFLCSLNILQILANLIVLLAYFTDSQLLANENIILLVSLAFIDFFYSSLSIPYLIVLFIGWVPNGKEYHYNEHVVLGFGSGPAALMKSGCTITTLIAIDRICALWAPMKYYSFEKKPILCASFIFSLLMAGFDLSLIFILSNGIRPASGCSGFACFASEEFRTYWGMSNMFVNLLSCLLTVVVAMLIKTRKTRKIQGSNAMIRKKDDKWASRASFYILVVSAIFGVVPGGINGYAQKIQSDFIKALAFYIQLCASISGLSHAFIFGMAHRLIRRRILVMLKLDKVFKTESAILPQNSIFPISNMVNTNTN